MRNRILLTAAVTLAISFGCTPARKSSARFHLPDGDPEKGKAVFVEMKCHTCHQVTGFQNPSTTTSTRIPVTLGGKVPYARTDGELVTSIIDPSYRLAAGYRKESITTGGRSLMPDMTHTMTIRQLIDLVAFLQAHYDVAPLPSVR